eukprot:6247658-Lingulodinium_polyedra.AAC.1
MLRVASVGAVELGADQASSTMRRATSRRGRRPTRTSWQSWARSARSPATASSAWFSTSQGRAGGPACAQTIG